MTDKIIVGWRESLSLPELGIKLIKAKVDTGAKTSCLHAFKVEPFTKDGEDWVRFWIHPEKRNNDFVQICEAKIFDQRSVKSSSGQEEMRYVIKTMIRLAGQEWPVQITLSNRETMVFRMLLGRTSMQDRIVVDPSSSYLVDFEENL
ncbi:MULTISPECIES: ATP-dependent zinc protease family protein [Aliivibrio]|jgi:hypothetical protein|uniref:Ribosomal protein S6 modification protein n=1 Tax=Aliivibrio sifiae TaxID=566293 RepID=A0A2S7XAZ4_9GAMM|nr:ATP-dependent zinc protease [Aliivibrio sifiae]PQJ88534.1 ribosomal protein S6 modification protein [Aliivibrio sifiae]PQJ94140.1 ribosomal protein S6 modification protein [Aliivibrio sifiae]GLR76958.1 ribosomal protein S6 modification protein [Aliivibrio sifiae]